MKGNIPNETQESRVLNKLREANGEWVNKQVFIRGMYLTQAGRAIFNLENNPKWTKEYEGMKIEHSDFTDAAGFKSYRLIPKYATNTASIAREIREVSEDEGMHIRSLFDALPAMRG